MPLNLKTQPMKQAKWINENLLNVVVTGCDDVHEAKRIAQDFVNIEYADFDPVYCDNGYEYPDEPKVFHFSTRDCQHDN